MTPLSSVVCDNLERIRGYGRWPRHHRIMRTDIGNGWTASFEDGHLGVGELDKHQERSHEGIAGEQNVNRANSTSDSKRSLDQARRGLLWIVTIMGIIGNMWMILTPPGYGRFSTVVFLGVPTFVLSAVAYLLGRIGHRPLITFSTRLPQGGGRLLGVCLIANIVVSGLMIVYLFFV